MRDQQKHKVVGGYLAYVLLSLMFYILCQVVFEELFSGIPLKAIMLTTNGLALLIVLIAYGYILSRK